MEVLALVERDYQSRKEEGGGMCGLVNDIGGRNKSNVDGGSGGWGMGSNKLEDRKRSLRILVFF